MPKLYSAEHILLKPHTSKIKMTITDEKTGQMSETIAKISGQTFGGERLDGKRFIIDRIAKLQLL